MTSTQVFRCTVSYQRLSAIKRPDVNPLVAIVMLWGSIAICFGLEKPSPGLETSNPYRHANVQAAAHEAGKVGAYISDDGLIWNTPLITCTACPPYVTVRARQIRFLLPASTTQLPKPEILNPKPSNPNS